jgi:predicted GNAT family acetyltransferase
MREFRMKVILLADVAEFLERTRTFRSHEPYLTNVMGTGATSVAAGLRHYEQMWWWVVEDETGSVCAMMMRTAPHNLVLSSKPHEAVDAAAAAVAVHDPQMPGLSGSKTLVESFLASFIEHSHQERRGVVTHNLLVYVLGTLIPPPPGSGTWRAATPSEFTLLISWWNGFADDTGVERHGLEEGLRASLDSGRVFLWVDQGQPVCAVAHSPIVDVPSGSVARIGPVYTPSEMRHRGYAGHLTAAVSAHLIDQGVGLMLFTDAANATSNAVYTRLRYEKVDEIVECAVVPV